MRFKGKIDLWFWFVMLLGESMLLGTLFSAEKTGIIWVITIFFYNLIFLPLVFRNYVEVTQEDVIVVIGFSKDSIAISDVQELYKTNNPIASSAASLDRIVIKGQQKMMMCAVQDQKGFFAYLKEKNPNIEINQNGKGKNGSKMEKLAVTFGVVVFLIVGVILLTGDIKMEYGKDSFTIKASYWYDKKIEYADIESITYVDQKISGSRVGGFGSFRLLLGDFENDAFGYYTRYTYANCEAGVVLLVNGREIVLSGKDKESTKEIYDELIIRCGL